MARFRYRMQNILDIKEKMETQAKNEFAQAQAKLNAEKEKLADRVSYRQKLQEDGGRLLLADRLDILKIDENKKMVSYAGEQVRAQTIQVRMAQKKLDEQRVRMQKAMQERKTHEILKEKAFDDFKVELKAAEGKEIDELTSYTYGQKSRDNG